MLGGIVHESTPIRFNIGPCEGVGLFGRFLVGHHVQNFKQIAMPKACLSMDTCTHV